MFDFDRFGCLLLYIVCLVLWVSLLLIVGCCFLILWFTFWLMFGTFVRLMRLCCFIVLFWCCDCGTCGGVTGFMVIVLFGLPCLFLWLLFCWFVLRVVCFDCCYLHCFAFVSVLGVLYYCFWLVFDCDFWYGFVNSVGIFYLFFNVALYRFMCFCWLTYSCCGVCLLFVVCCSGVGWMVVCGNVARLFVYWLFVCCFGLLVLSVCLLW